MFPLVSEWCEPETVVVSRRVGRLLHPARSHAHKLPHFCRAATHVKKSNL
jgi:hypothetical protein